MSTLAATPPPPPSTRLLHFPAGTFDQAALTRATGTDNGVRHFVDLRENAILALNASKLPPGIRCVFGLIWITQEGDDRDRVLHAGQVWRPATNGKAVVTAMTNARVEMVS